MEIKITSLDNIHAAAQNFAAHFHLTAPVAVHGGQSVRAFAFYGKMGAGKTTFIKALCDVLGVEDVVNSPTFAIVNEYHSTVLAGPVFHFDFYRIRRIEEAMDMGADEYFYSGSPCFIEWPELVEDILPEETIAVKVEETADGTRIVSF